MGGKDEFAMVGVKTDLKYGRIDEFEGVGGIDAFEMMEV